MAANWLLSATACQSAIFGKIGNKTINLAGIILHLSVVGNQICFLKMAFAFSFVPVGLGVAVLLGGGIRVGLGRLARDSQELLELVVLVGQVEVLVVLQRNELSWG